MRRTRMIAAAVGAAAMVVLPTSGAFAHDCFVITRDVDFVGLRGGWFGVDVDAAVADDVANGFYDAGQGKCLTDALPDKIAIKIKGANGNDGVLGTNNPHEGLLSNGKGVESIEAYFAACGIEA